MQREAKPGSKMYLAGHVERQKEGPLVANASVPGRSQVPGLALFQPTWLLILKEEE